MGEWESGREGEEDGWMGGGLSQLVGSVYEVQGWLGVWIDTLFFFPSVVEIGLIDCLIDLLGGLD